MSKRKVIALNHEGTRALKLADGFELRVTRFEESPRIALTIHGPEGGDAGGVILRPERALLLASWLALFADGMLRAGTP